MPVFWLSYYPAHVYVWEEEEEEEAEKGMTAGWSLHVNGSDSKIERASGEKGREWGIE